MKLKNDWKKYRRSGVSKDLSTFRRFQWICDYGNNTNLWQEIFVGDKPKIENGTSLYRFKNSIVIKIGISFLGLLYILYKLFNPYINQHV